MEPYVLSPNFFFCCFFFHHRHHQSLRRRRLHLTFFFCYELKSEEKKSVLGYEKICCHRGKKSKSIFAEEFSFCVDCLLMTSYRICRFVFPIFNHNIHLLSSTIQLISSHLRSSRKYMNFVQHLSPTNRITSHI